MITTARTFGALLALALLFGQPATAAQAQAAPFCAAGSSPRFANGFAALKASLGDVMGNLNSRRGRVESLEPVGNAQVVKASVPLAEMFGYATDLRSMTQGRAEFTMQFDRYEEVPNNLAESIVEGKTGEPVGASA